MSPTVRVSFVASVVGLSLASGCASSSTPVEQPARSTQAPISRVEVQTAQRAWCDALLSISSTSARNGDARGVADKVLSTAYDYDRGTVLFKPTLTHGEQTFRMDKRGALAYFVGGDSQYPNDSGFARKPWVGCEAKVAGVYTTPEKTIAMGNIMLTQANGERVTVDKTFGYVRGPDGGLRIVLHHSSLPHKP